MIRSRSQWVVVFAAFCLLSAVPLTVGLGEVLQSAPDGFHLKIEIEIPIGSDDAYRKFVDDFNKWYDASHSYSQNAENLSLDLEQHSMFERLPEGGFVRHMEISFHQPGKSLRMLGGLGPLQTMGVSGCMEFKFAERDGKTVVSMEYIVTGASFQKLDRLAAPVDGVMNAQLQRFADYCSE